MITTKETRKRRSDAGRRLWTERDLFALVWMADQYAIRLDHLQVLLSQRSGRVVSLGTTCGLMARWHHAGWVETKKIRAVEPLWIWPTQQVLHQLDLPYRYLNLDESSLDDLSR